MNLKIIVLVILISVLIGFGIFKLTNNKTIHPDQVITKQQSSNLAPTPKPTLEPIDQNSNLEQEIDKLTPEDFSEDFNQLKDELTKF